MLRFCWPPIPKEKVSCNKAESCRRDWLCNPTLWYGCQRHKLVLPQPHSCQWAKPKKQRRVAGSLKASMSCRATALAPVLRNLGFVSLSTFTAVFLWRKQPGRRFPSSCRCVFTSRHQLCPCLWPNGDPPSTMGQCQR